MDDDQRYRHELKFICSGIKMKQIEQRVRTIMQLDHNTGNKSDYLIRSIYFDDFKNSCFYDNENGNDPRSKFRIRAYDLSNDYIMLEKKIKRSNMTAKKSYSISFNDYQKMISGNILNGLLNRDDLLNEWVLLKTGKLLRPTIVVEYLRTPYVYRLGNVRITFDRNIMVSDDISGFFAWEISKIPVLPQDVHILEVKYDDYLPDAVRYIINDMHMLQNTFSKFYLGSLAMKGRRYSVI